MTKIAATCALLYLAVTVCSAQATPYVEQTFSGPQREGLRPEISVSRIGVRWHVDIGFEALGDFPRRTWLRTTNVVGAKLTFWSTNGQSIISKNPDVLAAQRLPAETTVSDAMRGVPRSRRGGQWMETFEGYMMPVAGFDVELALGHALTNDVILEVRPLLYRAQTNSAAVKLVEFSPTRLKLSAGGLVAVVTEEEILSGTRRH